ncbi:hypothetical protein HBI18_042070 [Parastagonospora nodorum]|nr:hypothetical protein HBH51_044880 [Parastagonospora nodorum]KAH5741094.1 hypothetical protein HBI18_042070 [Parastagonospora nodorum]
MSLYNHGRPDDNYTVAKDFADWLTGTRNLSIFGSFDGNEYDQTNGTITTHAWDVLARIAANFKDLEEFKIDYGGSSFGGSSFIVLSLIKRLRFPRLKRLEINGIWEWWDNGDVELARSPQMRTASFTTLRISGYRDRPQSAALLLQWPAVLTRLEFCNFSDNPEFENHRMDYPMFESWLRIHQNSLRHVEIGVLSRTASDRLFNATLFPKLEYLKLSRWQMRAPVQFSHEDSNVLGPSLKTFAWDFEEYGESWSDFGEAEANWITELAKCAISRKATLAKIEIQITPDACWEVTEEMEYPWDRIDSVRDQICRPNDLTLLYNKPVITKEAWLDLARAETLDIYADGADVDYLLNYDECSTLEEHKGLEHEFVQAYQGQDIRNYLIKLPNAP